MLFQIGKFMKSFQEGFHFASQRVVRICGVAQKKIKVTGRRILLDRGLFIHVIRLSNTRPATSARTRDTKRCLKTLNGHIETSQ